MNKEQVADIYRVIRGGSWYYNAYYCRAVTRFGNISPGYRYGNLGFRPCREVTYKDEFKEFKELMEEELFNE